MTAPLARPPAAAGDPPDAAPPAAPAGSEPAPPAREPILRNWLLMAALMTAVIGAGLLLAP